MSTLVVSLVRGSVRTAYGAARHPIATASHAVGLATGAVRLGVGVVQGRIPGSPPEQRPAPSRPAPGRPTSGRPDPTPSDGIRIPTPDEVAVRAVGPMPGAPGEAFATEPKVASRDVEHGGSATADREAVDGFLEDLEAGEPDSPIDAIGSTTGTPEPGEEAAVLSEAETLRRGAERNPTD